MLEALIIKKNTLITWQRLITWHCWHEIINKLVYSNKYAKMFIVFFVHIPQWASHLYKPWCRVDIGNSWLAKMWTGKQLYITTSYTYAYVLCSTIKTLGEYYLTVSALLSYCNMFETGLSS